MNPLFVTAIRAAKRAFEEMRHRHDHHQSSPSSENAQDRQFARRPTTTLARSPIVRNITEWFHLKKR